MKGVEVAVNVKRVRKSPLVIPVDEAYRVDL